MSQVVQRISSPEDLARMHKALTGERDLDKPCITICSGTGCQAYGCAAITDAFREELENHNLTGERLSAYICLRR